MSILQGDDKYPKPSVTPHDEELPPKTQHCICAASSYSSSWIFVIGDFSLTNDYERIMAATVEHTDPCSGWPKLLVCDVAPVCSLYYTDRLYGHVPTTRGQCNRLDCGKSYL